MGVTACWIGYLSSFVILLLLSQLLKLLLGRTGSRGRCWEVIRLSHRPEPSGHAVHGKVDGLDIGGQHGRRFVLLRHRGGHTPFVQAGVETSNTGAETVTPDPCSSWEASCVCTRWAGMRWVEQMSRLHGTACQSSVPSKIFVSRPVSKKCHQDQKKLRRPLYIFLKCVHFQRKYLSSIIVGEWLKRM